jgi:hypothetical protein
MQRGPNTKLASSLLLGLVRAAPGDMSYAALRRVSWRRTPRVDGHTAAGGAETRKHWSEKKNHATPENNGARGRRDLASAGRSGLGGGSQSFAAPRQSLPPPRRGRRRSGNCSHVDRPPRAYKTHRDESWGVR